MKFSFSLAATLLSLGLTQPALSATSVVIVQCSVTGSSFNATAASESSNIRPVVIGNDCARELEIYLMNQFTITNKFFGSQDGSSVTYTLIGP